MDSRCGLIFQRRVCSVCFRLEAIPALMVTLMPISWDLGSADYVLMSGLCAYLNHDVASMQLNVYFGNLTFWLLHALTLREATACLFLVFLLALASAFFVIASMVASPMQFPSITPIQDVAHPATRACGCRTCVSRHMRLWIGLLCLCTHSLWPFSRR